MSQTIEAPVRIREPSHDEDREQDPSVYWVPAAPGEAGVQVIRAPLWRSFVHCDAETVHALKTCGARADLLLARGRVEDNSQPLIDL